MAIITNVLHNGSKNFILHVYMEQDGGLGELADYVLVDPETHGLPQYPSLKLEKAWGALAWFDAVLKYGGVTPRPIWVFSRELNNYVNFSCFGGLSDRGDPPPSDDDGKILLSTSGFDVLGSQGTLLLAFKK